MATNIIDFQEYKAATVKTAEVKPKYFPIIYGLHTASGDPLVLFHFVSTDESAPKKEGNIIPINKNKE